MHRKRSHPCLPSAFLAVTALLFAPLLWADDGSIRCGRISDFRLLGGDSANEIQWAWNEVDYGRRSALAEGESFAIVTVRLTRGRSIGKYDYQLDGGPCLAMAADDEQFDPANWKYPFDNAKQEIRLIYRLQSGRESYELKPRLITREASTYLPLGSGLSATPPAEAAGLPGDVAGQPFDRSDAAPGD